MGMTLDITAGIVLVIYTLFLFFTGYLVGRRVKKVELFKDGFLKDCGVCKAHFKDIYEIHLKATLAKISTEVEQRITKSPWNSYKNRERDSAFLEVLEILDKYTTETEDT